MSEVQATTTGDIMKVLEECLRNPVLHPDHPGHDTTEKREDFKTLRAALQALYGPDANDIQPTWVPVCGTLPADETFQDSVCKQLTKLKNLLDMWDPTGTALSPRLDAFERDGMALLNGLLGADKLKAMVRRAKPHRRPDLLSKRRPTGNPGDGQYVDVPRPPKAKQVIVHYRSHHPHLSKQLVEDAYKSWLNLLYTELKVLDESNKPEASNPKIESTDEVDHIYVEDAKLHAQVAAEATFPYHGVKVYTIKISEHLPNDTDCFSYYALHGNALGCLRHEIGHTLGFLHEHTDAVAALLDRAVGAYDIQQHAQGADVKMDTESVMLYDKLHGDTKQKRVTPLSTRDMWGCQNFFIPSAQGSVTTQPNNPPTTQQPSSKRPPPSSDPGQGKKQKTNPARAPEEEEDEKMEPASSKYPVVSAETHGKRKEKAAACIHTFEELRDSHSPTVPSTLLDDEFLCKLCHVLTAYHRRAGPRSLGNTSSSSGNNNNNNNNNVGTVDMEIDEKHN